jgi:hypothetical protein
MAIKNVVMGIAIIILTIFVVVYGVSTFYDRPDYDDFCGERSLGAIETEAECIAVEGRWDAQEGPKPVSEDLVTGWCDVTYECRQDYDDAQEIYARNIFLITLPLGILLIVLGIVVFGLEVVGAGLAGGGVGVLLWGIGEYWRFGSNLLKFSLSLVGLGAVIWLAYWFNKKK